MGNSEILSGIGERELILLLKAGDMRGYRIMFRMYYDKFFRFISAVLGNRGDDAAYSEDILQDVFMKIWNNRKNLDENLSLKNYLYVLSKRAVLNHIRKYGREEKLHDDGAALSGRQDVAVPLSENSVDRTLSHREVYAIIKCIVDSMPEKRRRVFIMSRFNGMSNKEIAAVLNISVRTVDQHIWLALHELKVKIDGDG